MLTLSMSPPGKKSGGTGFQQLWRMPCQSCGGGQGQPTPIGIRCTGKDIRLMLNITHNEGIMFEKFYLSRRIALNRKNTNTGESKENSRKSEYTAFSL